ncbi:MAG: hypothetical protein A2504_04870 [Bdellovibrionales bacterium RIFOXYD12_FULL_39_22]|nr:MAG: hypothetical protein A2385_06955 [Bdellovibrionales bacterium RIFOXYB1_FULL_39_21]OFZ42004.1 MAG: hypothetical protein A2485_08925 [Bdellovibrionales bacterium RIFOXYC12_FULL_39_17]OFZ50720.1 MAG: hypothetical protein A2404_05875 [Bdellovibrionales bacterium RIFOXYC1_FULL_39_130]OFZ72773.1 MAG: hypothetical protein A2451_15035 [Bdellovibrionales bacterium RIFOXYC2_FULL_39_8]OFZ77943.1 MAG: hypothetical protein A2560_01045 [Bdellovibrionales bacterium RIFOXYD1_FULL_39_84]OFZ93621.1 MAG:
MNQYFFKISFGIILGVFAFGTLIAEDSKEGQYTPPEIKIGSAPAAPSSDPVAPTSWDSESHEYNIDEVNPSERNIASGTTVTEEEDDSSAVDNSLTPSERGPSSSAKAKDDSAAIAPENRESPAHSSKGVPFWKFEK